MQIKEYEALSLKECLQQVRDDMGPEAVILETRKFRRGGVMGVGAKDAICIVAATGITVQNDLPAAPKRPAPPRGLSDPGSGRRGAAKEAAEARPTKQTYLPEPEEELLAPVGAVSTSAARAVYARSARSAADEASRARPASKHADFLPEPDDAPALSVPAVRRPTPPLMTHATAISEKESARFAALERAMQEVREGLAALQRQQEAQDRKITAVVSAANPPRVESRLLELMEDDAEPPRRFPALLERLLAAGVAPTLAEDLLDGLPDFDAWSSPAQGPMAEAALRDLLTRRIPCAGGIQLTPGKLKAVALIGPTGVGKTTTIAKLAAHFSLVEGKKVGLLTVDTYRIAAVEQLKTYSQIIDIPIGVAYSQAEVLPAIEQFADFDLLLIDTAGRSQKNIMQVGELKALLESLNCETHLALSASIKEEDMIESVRRFSAACVDRIIFTKLDETGSYGTLLNVVERAGIPMSYVTSGQKVPEDIEMAEGRSLADLILGVGC